MEAFTLATAFLSGPYSEVGRYRSIVRHKVIELAVPFKDLRLQAGDTFKMSLLVTEHGLEVERYPRHQPISLTVPDRNFDAIMWRV